jgi:hypothetical protein
MSVMIRELYLVLLMRTLTNVILTRTTSYVQIVQTVIDENVPEISVKPGFGGAAASDASHTRHKFSG